MRNAGFVGALALAAVCSTSRAGLAETPMSANGPAPVTPAYWMSFALEMTNPTAETQATVNLSASRKNTRPEAEAEAMRICRSNSKNPQNCRILDSFNNGCKYGTTGNAPWGIVGYGSGATPQAAYNSCHANNLNCNRTVIGGCSDPANDMSDQNVVEAARVKYWAALAAGSGTIGNVKHVSTGFGTGASRGDAERRAVDKCNAASPGITCNAVGAFDTGCGYIANGKSSPGDSLGWGSDVTAQAAYDRCQATGSTCDTHTIGTCIR